MSEPQRTDPSGNGPSATPGPAPMTPAPMNSAPSSAASGASAPVEPARPPVPGTRPGPVASVPSPSTRFGGGDQPRIRMRQRLARLGAVRSAQSAVLDPLFKVVRKHHPRADLALLERAYRTAEHYHRGQLRKSGDPYITHPLAVTSILAELGMTEPTLVAALLHDTVEDTSYTMAQLSADFGDEVASLVDGVTKLDKVTYGDSAKAETLRKMVIAMSRDIRVLVIKLADRLHNLRTLHFLRPDKQRRIANETLEIFAPLAHRLGMNTIKWELEDLCFAVIEPKIYDEIVELVSAAAPQRERALKNVIDQIQADLRQANIKAIVYGRPKHYYSIYQKMVVRGREFGDIYDLVGIRIIVPTTQDCYHVLGLMHERWTPLPGRFKDYIALPKFNMYQSLHTTVLGPGHKPIELQIRTEDMHRRAEFGVAAHWRYKQRTGRTGEQTDLSWVHSLNQWSHEAEDPDEFLEGLRFEINADEVYVFTPKGDVVALPGGSTPVDFAYAVHTEVGHRTIGARVNQRLVGLDSVLENGDTVEVLTTKADGAGPSRDWLGFVRSGRAKSKIRQFFTKERREESIESGREQLARQLRKANLPLTKLLTAENLTAIANDCKQTDINGLYAAIGEGTIGAQHVVEALIALHGGVEETAAEAFEEAPLTRINRRSGSTGEAGVEVEGDASTWVKLAKCCTPLPGDEIIGFITRGDGVSVHRRDCTNVQNLLQQPERIVDVRWNQSQNSPFLVGLQIEGLDRSGMLSDVTRLLTEQHVNITSVNMGAAKNQIFKMTLTIEAADPRHLEHIQRSLKKVPGVYDVYRMGQ